MEFDFSKSFITAAAVLPDTLWQAAYSLSFEQRVRCEEIRLRTGRAPKALVNGRYLTLTHGGSAPIVSEKDIEEVVARATSSSLHTYSEQLKNGFVTTKHGHRIGLSGENIGPDGGLRSFSSANIRIAKPVYGPAEKLFSKDSFENTLIISPPGGGKTTLLRDAARYLSRFYPVSVCDERYEIAGVSGGSAVFDMGDCDILSGAEKSAAVSLLLRGLSPKIIVFDEITKEKDAEAVINAAHCGCGFLATAHCGTVRELFRRRTYRKLIGEKVFGRIIRIENDAGTRRYTVYDAEEADAENNRDGHDHRLVHGGGDVGQKQLSFEDYGYKKLYIGA